jgi:hypothetical protein
MSRPIRIAAIALVSVAVVTAVVVALVSSGLLAHRASDAPGPGLSLDRLQGTFVSTTQGSSTPQPLVDGRPVRIVVTGDRIGANAGCNEMGGTLSVENGTLLVGPLVQTEMACEPAEVMAQEAWVRDMLQARPAAQVGDGRLVLRWTGFVLVLETPGGQASTTSPSGTPSASDLPTVRPVPTATTPVPGTSQPRATTVPPVGPSKNTIPETPQGNGG